MKTLRNCKSKKEAKKRAPEYIIFKKNAWGDYLAFKSQDEYEMWKNQK